MINICKDITFNYWSERDVWHSIWEWMRHFTRRQKRDESRRKDCNTKHRKSIIWNKEGSCASKQSYNVEEMSVKAVVSVAIEYATKEASVEKEDLLSKEIKDSRNEFSKETQVSNSFDKEKSA